MAMHLYSRRPDRSLLGCMEECRAWLCPHRVGRGIGIHCDRLVFRLGRLGGLADRGSQSSGLLFHWAISAARDDDRGHCLVIIFSIGFPFNCRDALYRDASTCGIQSVGWAPAYSSADSCWQLWRPSPGHPAGSWQTQQASDRQIFQYRLHRTHSRRSPDHYSLHGLCSPPLFPPY